MRSRSAFTLIELLVVLVLLAITATAAIPAFAAANRDPEIATADTIVAVLTSARDAARESGARADVVIAPQDNRFWITTGARARTGVFPLAPTQRIVGSDAERVVCTFSPSGPTSSCAVAVRGVSDAIVRVDPWTGAINVQHNVR